MQERIFRGAWWIGVLLALPGALFFSVWLLVAVLLKFEPISAVLTGLFLAPFILASLLLFLRHRRRSIICDDRTISLGRGRGKMTLAWTDIREFNFDLMAGGRNRTLIYECRGDDAVIRFHRLPWPGEKDFLRDRKSESPARPWTAESDGEGYGSGASPVNLRSRATWSWNSRGPRLTRKDLEALRALIVERTGKQPARVPELLQRPG